MKTKQSSRYMPSRGVLRSIMNILDIDGTLPLKDPKVCPICGKVSRGRLCPECFYSNNLIVNHGRLNYEI